jgi:hypothetical protein
MKADMAVRWMESSLFSLPRLGALYNNGRIPVANATLEAFFGIYPSFALGAGQRFHKKLRAIYVLSRSPQSAAGTISVGDRPLTPLIKFRVLSPIACR